LDLRQTMLKAIQQNAAELTVMREEYRSTETAVMRGIAPLLVHGQAGEYRAIPRHYHIDLLHAI
jgi:hypothetical protein